MTDRLYYGDNLDVLRQYCSDECVDLIYLDPPFNSKKNYTKEKLGYWTLDYSVDLHRCCSSTRWHPGFRSSSLLSH